MLSLQPNHLSAAFAFDANVLQQIFADTSARRQQGEIAHPDSAFSFLYYGLVRILRPRHVVAIGAGLTSNVLCLALGLKDNAHGRLSFVDLPYAPAKSDNEKVRDQFAHCEVEQWVDYYSTSSEAFFHNYAGHELPNIDLALIDRNDTYSSVRRDFKSVLAHCHRNSYILLRETNVYLREFLRHAGTRSWLRVITRAKAHFQVLDLPFASGVALVRVLRDRPWEYSEQTLYF